MRATRTLPPEPGIWPIALSGRATRQSFVASRKSQASASSNPTPKQYFSSAAITGLRQRSGAPMLSARSDMRFFGIDGKDFTSPPEEKTPLAPRMQITPTSSSSSISSSRPRI